MTIENLRMTATEQLQATFDALSTLYVLVDPMLGEPNPVGWERAEGLSALQSARDLAWAREVTPIALDPRIPLPPHLHPRAFALGLHNRKNAVSCSIIGQKLMLPPLRPENSQRSWQYVIIKEVIFDIKTQQNCPKFVQTL